MPRLSPKTPITTVPIEFVASPALDLMNALAFTGLVEIADGIDGWPAETRARMTRQLRDELDFLITFPRGDPGVLGTLTDRLFAHPEVWGSVDELLRFVRDLPLRAEDAPPGLADVAVQSLVFYNICDPLEFKREGSPIPDADRRQRLADVLEATGADVEAGLAVYDRPKELRDRMVRLIERFYEEHYQEDQARRLTCLERSVAAHREQPVSDPALLARRLSGRAVTCLDAQDGEPSVCEGPYSKYVFAPSLDLGPYVSCADLGSLHGYFYPCEPEFVGEQKEEEHRRLARIYKALSDEQRLRILHLLRDHELYAQEIVERTGLHQSVVSRHLSFMTAVGLLIPRREGNMKFFALNPQIQTELAGTIAVFAAAESS